MDSAIKNFFYPKTVCVAGASSKEKSIGYELLNTIKTYGYKGKLFPINPNADEVLGYKCLKSIKEINEQIDLAVVMVPKKFVEETIDDLLEKGVKSIVLITAGFKETGKEGEELEKRILGKIKTAGARMVGPNCMGVIGTDDEIKLNATFVAEQPERGYIGFLSQSGALGAAILNQLRESYIRLSQFISVGNKADINENDILEYWQNDENIKSLTFYLESFVDGNNFVKPFFTGKITKPSIVLKAGKTSSGMKAASSHTGALGSSDRVVEAALKQAGIIRVDDINELFNTARGFENFPLPAGNRVAIVTNAGGPAILTVDACESEGLSLADLTEETKMQLREFVHPEGSVNNPIDLLPGGNAEAYRKTVELLAADPNVDSVISIFVEPVMVNAMPVIESINAFESNKPVLQIAYPLPEFWNNYWTNSIYKKPLFRNADDPAKILSNMLFFKKAQEKLIANKSVYEKYYSLKENKIEVDKTGYIDQNLVNAIAEKYKIPVIKSILIKPTELNKVTSDLYPLVIKGVSEKVIHKSELNAVKLNIKNEEELKIAAKEISDSFKSHNYEVEEFLVQKFVKTKFEVLVGGFNDPSFGPMLMFGTGGKYVEAINDTILKSAYLTDCDIEDMIDSTNMGKLLKGVRGEKPANLTHLKEIIKNTALMLMENKNIKEFDFNPLIVDENGEIFAVDIRINVE